MLMFIGGCAGSTAGGMKVIRIVIVFRTILADLLRSIHPRAVTPLKLGERVIPESTRVAVLGLFAAWILTFIVASLVIAVQPQLSLISSLSAVAATLNVVGPGLDQVGATESFGAVDHFGRVILTLCMLLGRLEILTALRPLLPRFLEGLIRLVIRQVDDPASHQTRNQLHGKLRRAVAGIQDGIDLHHVQRGDHPRLVY